MPDPLDPGALTGVAERGVGAWSVATPAVQMAALAALVLIIAIFAASKIIARKQDAQDGETVPASVMLTVTEEFGRQVASLTSAIEGLHEVVDQMVDTVTNCSTCPYHPKTRKDHS